MPFRNTNGRAALGSEKLDGYRKDLTFDDLATLGMILHTNGLPRLQSLSLLCNGYAGCHGDAGMQALCDGVGRGAAPSLRHLDLAGTFMGPVGAEALAATLQRGAMPNLETLHLAHDPIGNQGVAVLAAPLRKLPGLKYLYMSHCNIGDEGVASLVTELGKGEFKALGQIGIQNNHVTDVGVAKVVAALDAGALPKLYGCFLSKDAYGGIPASDWAVQAVTDALARLGNLPPESP